MRFYFLKLTFVSYLLTYHQNTLFYILFSFNQSVKDFYICIQFYNPYFLLSITTKIQTHVSTWRDHTLGML